MFSLKPEGEFPPVSVLGSPPALHPGLCQWSVWSSLVESVVRAGSSLISTDRICHVILCLNIGCLAESQVGVSWNTMGWFLGK